MRANVPMSRARWRRLCATALLALTLAACGGSSDSGGGSGGGGGGGGGGDGQPPPAGSQSPGGIWYGTFTLDGEPAGNFSEGLVTEDGRFVFNVGDEAVMFGMLDVTGDRAVGLFESVVLIDDEEYYGVGDLDLTVEERERIDGTFFLEVPELAESGEGVLELDYDPLYALEPSLALLVGDWVDPDDPMDLFSIGADGSFFSQDPDTNCTINATVDVLDDRFNAYEVVGDVDGCTPASGLTFFNGADMTALIYLDDTGASDRLRGGVVFELGNDEFLAFWLEYDRN